MFKLFIYLFMTVKKVLYSPWSNYCTKFLVQIQIFMFHAIDAVLNKNEHVTSLFIPLPSEKIGIVSRLFLDFLSEASISLLIIRT